jgi:hypothetical protein
VGGEEFTQVLGLLGRAPIVKGEQNGVEPIEVNPRGVPAAIEIRRRCLGRDEAAIDLRDPTPRRAQGEQRLS